MKRIVTAAFALLLMPWPGSPTYARPRAPVASRSLVGNAAPTQPDTAIEAAPTLQSEIARREYDVSESDLGLQAPNRAGGLRTYFDGDGARIVDREAGTTIARLRTMSIGRGVEAVPLSIGEVTSSGSRVELRRAGLVEWFENTSRGLEHGWTLETRPSGNGPLVIDVGLGEATATVEPDRLTLIGGGRRLDYGELSALDAHGTAVAARFEPEATGSVRIVVDDACASYPLMIDPMLTSVATTGPPSPTSPPDADVVLQGDQAASLFGTSVAGAGDVNGDGYDDIIVGAPNYDFGQTNEGAAFVFHGSPSGVGDGSPSNADAVLQSDQAGAEMGVSVAGAGDVNGDGFDDVIIGAGAYDRGQTDEGASFVFLGGLVGIGDHSAEEADAILESNQASGGLGLSVAGAGDVNGDGYGDVVVGAPQFEVNQLTLSGAVFVFHGGPTGISDGNASSADGRLDGDLVGELIGSSVSSAGDVNSDGFDDVIVGGPGFVGGSSSGAAFVFHGAGRGIGRHPASSANATFTSSDQQQGTFGNSVDGAGDVNGDGFDDVIVGAQGYEVNSVFVGGAFVFHGGALGVGDGSPANADAVLLGDIVGSFGESVAGAGDIDGDHFDDVIVGDPSRGAQMRGPSVVDGGVAGLGGAFVFHGGPLGVGNGGPASADTAYESDQGSTAFGGSVAGVGDTNGDFSADVAVGAAGYDLGQTDEGAAFVFVGPVLAVGSGADTPGVYSATSGAWFLRNLSSAGPADLTFIYGAGGSGLVPIKGDWNGDSLDTPGVYDPATSTFFLRNASAAGPADLTFAFGATGLGYVPVAGDWDNNGTDTVGLYQPSTSTFFLTNVNGPGPASLVFSFGVAGLGYVPITGDWDDNGTDTVGLYLPSTSTFFLRNAVTPGPANLVFSFGATGVGYLPLAGDYDGDGRDTVGLYDPSSGAFFLTNANAPGPASLVFVYGAPNMTPLVGDWNAL